MMRMIPPAPSTAGAPRRLPGWCDLRVGEGGAGTGRGPAGRGVPRGASGNGSALLRARGWPRPAGRRRRPQLALLLLPGSSVAGPVGGGVGKACTRRRNLASVTWGKSLKRRSGSWRRAGQGTRGTGGGAPPPRKAQLGARLADRGRCVTCFPQVRSATRAFWLSPASTPRRAVEHLKVCKQGRSWRRAAAGYG